MSRTRLPAHTRSREREDRAVLRTLESSYTTPAIRDARERQDRLLVEHFARGRRRVADLGCGTGPHGLMLGPGCELYHGYEISEETAAIARGKWREAGLTAAEVFVGDMAEVPIPDVSYDLVLCLYFTPGNIRDALGDLAQYTDAYLDRNPRFVAVVSRFRQAMAEGGTMLLTVYKDVRDAEAAQIDFYNKTGQHPVTPRGSRFVATAEGFWSVRWTRDSLLSNLSAAGVPESSVTLHDLNPIAWLVEVRK